MNAIELLKQQHQKVKHALEQMSEGEGNASAARTLANELVAHMVIEEHIFYPRMKELMGDELYEESFEEHAVARFELARLLQSSGAGMKTRATVLKELIAHHVEEEEKEMFPKVQKKVDAAELDRLGVKMLAAFEKAVAKGFGAFFEDRTSGVRRSAPANGISRTTAAHASRH
jgi:hemerythrin superfamily protein